MADEFICSCFRLKGPGGKGDGFLTFSGVGLILISGFAGSGGIFRVNFPLQEENRCAKCGACMAVCPVYLVTGRESLTARGRNQLFSYGSGLKRSWSYADIFSKCLLCGACNSICPGQIDTTGRVIRVRQELGRFRDSHSLIKTAFTEALSHPALFSQIIRAAASVNELLLKSLPAESGPRLRLNSLTGGWLPHSVAPWFSETRQVSLPESGKPGISYFTGCLAGYMYSEIGYATESLIEKGCGLILDAPVFQTCCGLAALASGDLNLARKLAKANITAFESNSLPVVTSCASCFVHLRAYPNLFKDDDDWRDRALCFAQRVHEFSTYLAESPEFQARYNDLFSGSLPGRRKVLYHDPCHLRFSHNITAPPRRLIAGLETIDILELPRGPQCCGHGGLFSALHRGLSGRIFKRLMADFASIKAEVVLTTCSGCLLQWNQGLAARGSRAKAVHLGVFLAECLRV